MISSLTTTRRFRAALFVCVLLTAAALRWVDLNRRPLHTDEAVHAVKFGQLLEQGTYRYDPIEYHGPSLVYSTLLPAWIRGQRTLTETDEITLRIVPALFGLLLVAMAFFLPRTHSSVAPFAMLLTGLSPAFVFYSRYYIMEMQLAVFAFAFLLALYRFSETRSTRWAIAAGAAMGLMHASKETCVLNWFAAGTALLVIGRRDIFEKESLRVFGKIALGLLIGAVISALFFSSFGQNPRGVIDSILTYKFYLQRGSGEATPHVHPWFTYLKWLAWNHTAGRPLWTEGFILLLGAVGAGLALFKPTDQHPKFWRFIALYTVILTVIYALLPYKTPWSLLSFYHGWVLLAGYGASMLWGKTRPRLNVAFAVILLIGIMHLGFQAKALSWNYDTDASNPYVYAHTHRDIFKLTDAVEQLCRSSALGKEEYIEVICPGDDYWPLPWYLRRFKKVGYFSQVDLQRPPARLIIAMPQVQSDLLTKLYELPPPGQRHMYLPFFENGLLLRDGVEIDLFVRKDLWDEWRHNTP